MAHQSPLLQLKNMASNIFECILIANHNSNTYKQLPSFSHEVAYQKYNTLAAAHQGLPSSSRTVCASPGSLLMPSTHLALIRPTSRLCFNVLSNCGVVRVAKNLEISAALSLEEN
jgi:hypothetical protein